MRIISQSQVVPGDGELHNLREAGRALATGIERVCWREPLVQVLPCAECYQPGCIDGNTIELRRLPGFVAWTPSPLVERSHEPWRIGPPQRFANLGFPLWPRARWDELVPLIGWPRWDELAPLTWDAARLLAAEEAPPRLPLDGMASWELADDLPVVIAPAGDAARLTFTVEDPDEEHTLFARRHGRWWPLVRPDLLIIPAGDAAPTAA